MYGFKHFGIVELKRELEELSTSCIFEGLVCLLGGKGGVHFFYMNLDVLEHWTKLICFYTLFLFFYLYIVSIYIPITAGSYSIFSMESTLASKIGIHECQVSHGLVSKAKSFRL